MEKKMVVLLYILVILISGCATNTDNLELLNGEAGQQDVANNLQEDKISKDPVTHKTDNQEVEMVWKENSLTQPLHPQASKTRLSLPAIPEDLMPDGSQIVGFGVHVGQHIEGLDHVWIPIKRDVPSKAMGDGKVIGIGSMGYEGKEYMINVDYGNGLYCVHGEINKLLVELGQTVKHLDPIGEVNRLGGFENVGEIEIYCEDENIKNGLVSSNGHGYTAVSPFDYLNDKDKELLEKIYIEKVINPFLTSGKVDRGSWSPLEPFLTNKIIIHEPNKIVGEWFLINKNWDGKDLTLITFIESNNKYYTGNGFRLRSEDQTLSITTFIDGDYEVIYKEEGKGKMVLYTEYETYYALFEILEDAGTDSAGAKRAQMKFEFSEIPITVFSDNALTYQSRGVWNPRYDAWKLGGWLKYG